MLALVPEWAGHYGEFWRAIRARNLWFIKLRYAAVLILFGFLLSGQFIFKFNLTTIQIKAIVILSISILVYNVIIYNLRKYAGCEPDKFNCLHISLIQMVCDLIALMFLVYFTGTTDSPLYMLFIFHMIIGSLILPGAIVYFIAALLSIIFSILILLVRAGIFQNHLISGIFAGEKFHTISHDALFMVVFTFMIFSSVYLANKIAKQLYKMEYHLRESLDKLNQSEIAKQKYTIGIVHEIKTPINAVTSILELIHQNYIGPISKEVDEKIMRAKTRTEEALHLINNVLRISKLKLLEIKMTEEIDLRELISNIIDGLVESFQEKNITFNFVEKRQENKLLKSDRILLELAVTNVLTNAIKYVNRNGKIEFCVDDDENEIKIEISDNGIGIPSNEQEKIFEQFYRASNIDKSIHEGSGLGLSLVKEIVEKLGGNIKVYSPSKISEPDKPGTTFQITFPYNYKPSEYDIFEVNDSEYLSSQNTF